MRCAEEGCDTTWPDDLPGVVEAVVAHHQVAHGREWAPASVEVVDVEEP